MRSLIKFQKESNVDLTPTSDMKFNIPIYRDDEVSAFVEKIASKKGIDRSSVVNELLKGNIKIAEAME